MVIQNTDFSQNLSFFGGAIVNFGSVAFIEKSRFVDNAGIQLAGAIATIQGTLQITDSLFSNNQTSGNGGAIFAVEHSDTFILNSTMNNNSATGVGGAVFVGQEALFSFSNSTMSGNQAAQGGGIFAVDSSTQVDINLSTIALNSASNGGGIYNQSNADIEVYHSIIANNVVNNCASSGGNVINNTFHGLFGDLSCTFSSGSNTIENVNPLLGPLQDNGGFTPTHALLPGSPAIDGGELNCQIDTDQRGQPRPVNIADANPIDNDAHCDIGSYEAQPAL